MAKRAKKKQSAARRSSRQQKKLSDLFHETLKDIYFAENKIIKTLPKMAKAAQSKELAAAFNKHLKETCLLYTSPSPRDGLLSRMPSSA